MSWIWPSFRVSVFSDLLFGSVSGDPVFLVVTLPFFVHVITFPAALGTFARLVFV